ncbi:MNNL domain-containing protein [Aphelenchoides besseyi]|nr:MNNL domain-containing protein [Aphelenchoides besseyi]
MKLHDIFCCLFFLVSIQISYAHSNLDLRLSNDFNSTCPHGCYLDVCIKHFQHVYIEKEDCIFGNVQIRVKEGGKFASSEEQRIPLLNTMESVSVSVKVFEDNQTTEHSKHYFWSGTLPREFRRLPMSNIFFRGRCDENYFGKNCQRFCRVNPMDDQRGYFVCNQETGEKECAPLFEGEDCNKRKNCSSICTNGECSATGKCLCRYGFRGTKCDQCIRSPGCVYGFCTRPYECNCFPDYTGDNCTILRRKPTNPTTSSTSWTNTLIVVLIVVILLTVVGLYALMWTFKRTLHGYENTLSGILTAMNLGKANSPEVALESLEIEKKEPGELFN